MFAAEDRQNLCGQLFRPTLLFIAHILAEFLGHAALWEMNRLPGMIVLLAI